MIGEGAQFAKLILLRRLRMIYSPRIIRVSFVQRAYLTDLNQSL